MFSRTNSCRLGWCSDNSCVSLPQCFDNRMAHPPPKPVVVDDTLLLQFVIALLVCLTGAALSLLVDEDVLSAAGGEEQEVARGTDFTCPEEVLPILQVFRRCRLMYDDDGNEMPRKKRAKKNWNHRRAEASVYTDFLGSPHPTFNDRQFERIFRITRTIAERLLCICGNSDDFFTQKVDACGAPGITSYGFGTLRLDSLEV